MTALDLSQLQAAVRAEEPASRAIHLTRTAAHPLFFKVAADRKQVTHVAKLRGMDDLAAMKPFLHEAQRVTGAA